MPSPQSLRKTKIVATIGPASSGPEILEEMIRAGMNVARLNLSHGEFTQHQETVKRIRQSAGRLQRHVAIMADTRGIEVRTGRLVDGPVSLQPGQPFTLYTDGRRGNNQGVSVSFNRLPEEVEPGDCVLLDDAALELEVTATGAAQISCTVIHGGTLGERKSINLPGRQLSINAVSAEFREQLQREVNFAVDNQVDYLAASFVQSGPEVEHIRALLAEQNSTIPIIAKIENRSGVDNIEGIIAAADGIMVARGDLGVELPLAEVPGTQKRLIRDTVMNGKPVITATQMLASMETNPKPTRAEASDVANAILDGTSAVMLSGETAVGRYPVEAIRTMAAIALRAEASLKDFGYLQTIHTGAANKIAEAVGQAAARLAEQLQATAIITLTDSGFTARLISKHRPECAIIAVTGVESVARRLSLNWGVLPLLREDLDGGDDVRTEFGCAMARKLGYLEAGDTVVVTHGTRPGMGGTDLIRVMTVL